MGEATHQNHVIQTQRTIPYVPDEVYAAFSDLIRLAKWWGPKDFTNTFEAFEFKVGSNWKYMMHGPDGHDYRNNLDTQVKWVSEFEDPKVAEGSPYR